MLENLLFSSFLGLTLAALCAAFSCPSNQHLYTGCSTCLEVAGSAQSMDFASASDFCKSGGGRLISFNGSSDIQRLSRYLEGLREERQGLWVGLRFTPDGTLVDTDGIVNDLVGEGSYFAPSDSGVADAQRCVGIQGGKFFMDLCTRLMRFICAYEYSVPIATELSPALQEGTVYARSSSNLTLTGTIPGAGVSGVEWRLNGFTIENNQNGFVLTQHSVNQSQMLWVSLEVSSFDSSLHSGSYQLVVHAVAGTAVLGEWLVEEAVLGSLSDAPNNLTVPHGHLAAFECHAPDSLPLPHVTWFKDSERVQLSRRVLVSQETGTLFIRNVSAMADEGAYHCMLENTAGGVNSTEARLTIRDAESKLLTAEMYIHPRGAAVALGKPFVVQCVSRFDGNGAASGSALIEYYLHDNFVDRIGVYCYPVNESIPEFRVQEVSLQDNGSIYGCAYAPRPPRASSYGEALLTVYAAAFVDQFWTELNGMQSSSSLQSIPKGSTVTVHSTFIGSPEPDTVEWYQNETLLISGDSTLSFLTLRDVQESSVVQCRVANQHGSGLGSVFLCVDPQQDGIPGAVSFLALPDSNSSIYVEWNETTSSIDPLLLRYELTIWGPLDLPPSDEGTVENVTLLAEVSSYLITGLEPNAMYRVGVAASSLEGRGLKREAEAYTFPNVPTESILNFTVQRTAPNTEIVVGWEPFLPANETRFPLAGYEVEYRLVDSMDMGEVMRVSGGDTLSTVVRLEEPDADKYEVRIRVQVQTQRDPPLFSFGPWSEYLQVDGVVLITRTPPTGGMGAPRDDSNPTGLLLIIVCVPVGVVLLLTIAITITTLVSCWYRKRPEGQYTVTDSERVRKTTASFESSSGSNTRQSPPTSSTLVLSDQTDGRAPPTGNKPTHFGVTVSVVDTTSGVERDQPQAAAASSTSLREEFDHLETLVSTLNETVTSMAGVGGATRAEGSDTSIVINNNGAFPEYAVPEYAVVRKSQLVAADSGASYAVHLASREDPYHSSSASMDGSPPPLPRPFDTESEGSDTSIVKQNLVALCGGEELERDEPGSNGARHLLQSHSYSRNTHTGSDCSMSTAGGEDGHGYKWEGPGSAFHSTATLEGSGVNATHTDNEGEGVEFDENLVELLKYGDSVDLTMV